MAAARAGLEQCGHEKRLKARVVVYADDFVILCREDSDAGKGTD